MYKKKIRFDSWITKIIYIFSTFNQDAETNWNFSQLFKLHSH